MTGEIDHYLSGFIDIRLQASQLGNDFLWITLAHDNYDGSFAELQVPWLGGDGGKHGGRMRRTVRRDARDRIGAREIEDLLIENLRRILCFAP